MKICKAPTSDASLIFENVVLCSFIFLTILKVRQDFHIYIVSQVSKQFF